MSVNKVGGALSESALQTVACELATAAPLTLPSLAAQRVAHAGGVMRRLFCIWNKGYKTQCVIATDIQEALELAAKGKHISRATMYRKFSDVTETTLAEDPTLERALAADISGIATSIEGNGWKIGDVTIT